MILPVYLIGHPILKKVAEPITSDYPGLQDIIQNMWDTMYAAHGAGIAAPQVGLPIRLFVIDTIQLLDKKQQNKGFKKVFINAEIIHENGEPWDYEEGCLSIPTIRGDVTRPQKLRLRYQDENFESYEEDFDEVNARVIQHEYDHIEGKLFVEKLKPLKKRRIQRKLEEIKRGEVECDYRIKAYRP